MQDPARELGDATLERMRSKMAAAATTAARASSTIVAACHVVRNELPTVEAAGASTSGEIRLKSVKC
jgi:hypothetical protein